MLREHEAAFESHIFDPAAASAYKENRHSLRTAATQGTLTSEQNIFGNIAQLAERLAVNQEVVGSRSRLPARSVLQLRWVVHWTTAPLCSRSSWNLS